MSDDVKANNGHNHMMRPPTGDEKPQVQYASPYLDKVEEIQRELKRAAATGQKPKLDGYTAVDLAGAGVLVQPTKDIVNRQDELKEAEEGLPKVNERGATSESVKADPAVNGDENKDLRQEGDTPAPGTRKEGSELPEDQKGLPNQGNVNIEVNKTNGK